VENLYSNILTQTGSQTTAFLMSTPKLVPMFNPSKHLGFTTNMTASITKIKAQKQMGKNM
jgi:hypothetical protein